mgnify:CR=1 FL=1
MGFRLAVSGGAENINLDEKTIQKVTFSSDSATDSNARGYRFWHCGKDYRKNVV